MQLLKVMSKIGLTWGVLDYLVRMCIQLVHVNALLSQRADITFVQNLRLNMAKTKDRLENLLNHLNVGYKSFNIKKMESFFNSPLSSRGVGIMVNTEKVKMQKSSMRTL